MMQRWVWLWLLLLPLTGQALDIAEELADPEQQAIYEKLLKEVRCLVCQNQPIGDSNAPLAADLRREIRDRLKQGEDEAAVKEFLLARYGDFVLYRPRFTASTALLWVLKRRASLPIPDELEEQQMRRREEA